MVPPPGRLGDSAANYGIEDDEEQPLLRPLGEFKVIAPKGIPIRDKPCPLAERTGEVLEPGTIFAAVDIVTINSDGEQDHWDHPPVDDTCFFFLGGERGWVVSRNIVTEDLLVEPHLPAERVGALEACRGRMRLAFQGKCYEYSIMAVVLANAVFIGLEIDHHHMMSGKVWMAVNVAFTIIYVVELVLKLGAFGVWQYFESRWNQFDFIVTTTTVVGDLMVFYVSAAGYKDNQDIKVLAAIAPLLRLLRLLRLAKAFRDLRTLMKALMSSIGSLLWIAVFAILWFYISACITTVFIGSTKWLPDGSVPEAKNLRNMFRNIPMSMFSLFEVMTLEGWTEAVRPFLGKHLILVIFFISFIFVTAFFLLNLVTAVVVDRTLQAQHTDKEAVEAIEGDSFEVSVKELEEELSRRNKGDDYCPTSDILAWAKLPQVKRLLDKINWDHDTLVSATVAVDLEADGSVSLEKLGRLMAVSAHTVDALALLRVQADVTRKLDKQEELLAKMLQQKQERAGWATAQAPTSADSLASCGGRWSGLFSSRRS